MYVVTVHVMYVNPDTVKSVIYARRQEYVFGVGWSGWCPSAADELWIQ